MATQENTSTITIEAAGAPASATVDATSDLIIVINPYYNFDFTEFLGTRATLEAEGVIPGGTDWPQGYDNLRWQAGQFD